MELKALRSIRNEKKQQEKDKKIQLKEQKIDLKWRYWERKELTGKGKGGRGGKGRGGKKEII